MGVLSLSTRLSVCLHLPGFPFLFLFFLARYLACPSKIYAFPSLIFYNVTQEDGPHKHSWHGATLQRGPPGTKGPPEDPHPAPLRATDVTQTLLLR